jgi:hypothetical protein
MLAYWKMQLENSRTTACYSAVQPPKFQTYPSCAAKELQAAEFCSFDFHSPQQNKAKLLK